MQSIICPISSERIEESTARVTGFLVVIVLVCAIWFGAGFLVGLLVVDYFIRAFTSSKFSPLSRLAREIVRGFRWPLRFIDKAPKIFAARVGFLFAASGLSLIYFIPMAGHAILLVLCVFAFLESVANFCMGCFVYTKVVLKIYK